MRALALLRLDAVSQDETVSTMVCVSLHQSLRTSAEEGEEKGSQESAGTVGPWLSFVEAVLRW